jgi:hypothetical protein
MKTISNPAIKARYRWWTYTAYFLKRIARGIKIPPSVSSAVYQRMALQTQKKKMRAYKKLWLVQSEGEAYFDINGAKFPDVSNNLSAAITLLSAFEDIYTIPYFYEDNYDKTIVENVDRYLMEGPYGYTDGGFDVTIKNMDAVIDAGAWIGDFSAYAASKGATVYAFEPVKATFQMLCKTKKLNNVNGGGGEFIPYEKDWATARVILLYLLIKKIADQIPL